VTLTFPPVTLEICEGDLTSQPLDAIVNAANSALWMGAGVAGAIRARGGVEIEREAVALGPIEPGEAVIMGAGRLAARHVIHAAAMGPDLRTDATLIGRATKAALDLAAARGLTSIGLPALGTGVGGFPLGRCAILMAEAVKAHASGPTSLRIVRIVLFGRRAYDDVVGALSGHQSA
jgi:O-acetyl-ADP-ribose deacetylase (regulator of RNase III)